MHGFRFVAQKILVCVVGHFRQEFVALFVADLVLVFVDVLLAVVDQDDDGMDLIRILTLSRRALENLYFR